MEQAKQPISVLDKDHVQKLEQIAAVIVQLEAKPSNLIKILHSAQNIYGYLPFEVQKFIAEKMKMPVSEISGVVTFYSFFSTEPRGKHTVRLCTGTACYVNGGKKSADMLKEELNVEIDGTTEDGKFTLCKTHCLGACGMAPAMMIDNSVYRADNQNKIKQILSKY